MNASENAPGVPQHHGKDQIRPRTGSSSSKLIWLGNLRAKLKRKLHTKDHHQHRQHRQHPEPPLSVYPPVQRGGVLTDTEAMLRDAHAAPTHSPAIIVADEEFDCDAPLDTKESKAEIEPVEYISLKEQRTTNASRGCEGKGVHPHLTAAPQMRKASVDLRSAIKIARDHTEQNADTARRESSISVLSSNPNSRRPTEYSVPQGSILDDNGEPLSPFSGTFPDLASLGNDPDIDGNEHTMRMAQSPSMQTHTSNAVSSENTAAANEPRSAQTATRPSPTRRPREKHKRPVQKKVQRIRGGAVVAGTDRIDIRNGHCVGDDASHQMFSAYSREYIPPKQKKTPPHLKQFHKAKKENGSDPRRLDSAVSSNSSSTTSIANLANSNAQAGSWMLY